MGCAVLKGDFGASRFWNVLRMSFTIKLERRLIRSVKCIRGGKVLTKILAAVVGVGCHRLEFALSTLFCSELT